ncbi:platelet-activating factor acetylhydrolase 1b, catalytic subunit [Seminavis robusta]|uniref:Platelet-activating factor acetylhydrolase 1b, catalytic subunit n=1 Tax=Seminavis robusta TaxID=568900 RepID=A0A9N8DXL8_9STRA|nr:platelet-activating factor acetylhydrolase 1b, catalytic subunit [Seminavis robusta]|eukprot:Sro349_g123470.1 platelet-activating factor acetylhydrolase 1b, catalytic subunit (400) ;mRNA; r:38848-40162
MDNHEPYHDDADDDEDENGDFPSSFSAGGRMQPMSVAAGGDFDASDGSDNSKSTRKAVIATLISIVFLVVGLLWTRDESKDGKSRPTVIPDGTDRGHLNGFGDSVDSQDDDPCQGYDTSYYTDLIWRVEAMNETDPLLCQSTNTKKCECLHPLRPQLQSTHPGWKVVVQMNVDLLQQNYSTLQPDVVLYGDSMVEHLIGRNYGHHSVDYQDTAVITKQLMTKRGGGHINALPMGIAADQIANLLYRISSGGEMPESLHPKIWWLMIGTTDLQMGCSIDAVVAGVIHIAQTILKDNPHQTLTPIVLNSLLPRGEHDLFAEDNAWKNVIAPVNQRLACFAQLTPGVEFVNSTNLVVTTTSDSEEGTHLNESLVMVDHVHLNTEGNRLWEQQIVSNVMELMV